MRFLLTVALWLLFLFCRAQAEVKILTEHRVPNRGSGYCVWCCLETIGNHFGIKELQGLVDWYVNQGRGGAATASQVDRQLDALGIRYIARYYGQAKEINFIKRHTDAGRPVMVSVTGWINAAGGSHAILITHVTDTKVYIVDPNDTEHMYTWDISSFMSKWESWAVVVIPPANSAKR